MCEKRDGGNFEKAVVLGEVLDPGVMCLSAILFIQIQAG